MPGLNPAALSMLTFDCYGTLIDWEAGAIKAMRPLLAKHQVALCDDDIVATMGGLEDELIQPPYRSYRSVLASVVEGFGKRFGFATSDQDNAVLAASIPSWTPFPDTIEALRKLAARYPLAIISNIDDDLFAHTAKQLPIRFADVITAEQAQSYKPHVEIFERAIRRLGVAPGEIAHIAEGAAEIVPARKLGCATVWIRRNGRSAGKLTKPPDEEYSDIRSLAARLDLGR